MHDVGAWPFSTCGYTDLYTRFLTLGSTLYLLSVRYMKAAHLYPLQFRAMTLLHLADNGGAAVHINVLQSQEMVHLSVAEVGSWGSPSSPKASPGARSCTISSGGCPHACICTANTIICKVAPKPYGAHEHLPGLMTTERGEDWACPEHVQSASPQDLTSQLCTLCGAEQSRQGWACSRAQQQMMSLTSWMRVKSLPKSFGSSS